MGSVALKRLPSHLQIRAWNAAAIEFYRTIGFRVDDVASMEKRLDLK